MQLKFHCQLQGEDRSLFLSVIQCIRQKRNWNNKKYQREVFWAKSVGKSARICQYY